MKRNSSLFTGYPKCCSLTPATGAYLPTPKSCTGLRTEKGEFNRWIKATNAVIRDIKKKIALLFDWIAEAKAELAKPQAPDLVSLLNAYYTQRRAGAYSQKGKVSNLKEMNETFNYLRANGIYSLEDVLRKSPRCD